MDIMVHPDVPEKALRRLAAAVILQAIADLKTGSDEDRKDAALWFASQDFQVWADWAGIPFARPEMVL